jgi:hypothetical protein
LSGWAEKPLWWHKERLHNPAFSQASPYILRLLGEKVWRRVYFVGCGSNSASCVVKIKGEKIFLDFTSSMSSHEIMRWFEEE